MPRRARGDGTIYFDEARGRWIGAVTISGRRRKVSGKDKTEARAKLRALLAARDTGSPIGDRRLTVGSLLAHFLEREIPNRISNGHQLAPRTLESYRWAAKIIDEELGTTRVAELDVTDVERMLDRLAKRRTDPMSAASLRKVRGVLRQALEFGEKRGQVARNPARWATITPKAAGRKAKRSLTHAEARRLFTALANERNGAMFGLQLRLGLRPGEAAALHWSDLHGEALNVTRGLQLEGGRAGIVDDLKNATSKRTIALAPDLVELLTAHRATQVNERLAASRWIDDRLMFASPSGNVLSPSNVRKQLRALCDRVRVPEISPNELRHSCASLLSDMGMPNESIADLLGHTTTRMVDQTYRHRLRPVIDVAASVDWSSAS